MGNPQSTIVDNFASRGKLFLHQKSAREKMSSKKKGVQSKKAADRKGDRDVFSRKKNSTAQNVAKSVAKSATGGKHVLPMPQVQFVFQSNL